jgi:ATP-dependent RNA helicase DHX29
VRTSRTFIRDCTVASPAAILLFGGALSVAHDSSYVQVDGWLRIRAPAQTAVLVKRLRQALDALLERKVRQPAARLEDAGGALIQSIVDLLNTEEAAQRWQR